MNRKRTSEEILASLEENTPDYMINPQSEELIEGADNAPSLEVMTKDAEDDLEFILKETKELLEKQKEAIDLCMDVARGSEHPRAFEVLGGLIADGTKMAHMIMQQHEKRRKLNTKKAASTKGFIPNAATNNGSVTNNTVFVGSTTELQKFIKSQNEAKVVDV